MKNNNLKNYKFTDLERAYIAGFLDGDGSIICQIVRSENHRFGFYIRISIVFIQRTDKY